MKRNIIAIVLTASMLFGCARNAASTAPAPGGIATSAAPTIVPSTLDPNAPTFYVATDGNDENGDGSATAPWATITHALDSVADGSLILVRPGLYLGRVRIRGLFANGVTVRSEIPYRAQLRADETVMTIFEAQGITIEGFDIAHASPAAEPIVVQIQDGIGEEPGGDEFTSNITLRNNILHDSYNNDILKINNGAQQILISGNIFYNQGDSDEHIDINSVRDVVVEDNIFFNDFAASGRAVSGGSSSFVVAKDSNGEDDGIVGMSGLIVRRNIFLHYEGSDGHNMLLLGEDGNAYYEVSDALIENNLFLGDGSQVRAPFGAKGVQNVVFRHNTITGDMPSGAFAWRSNTEGENQPNDNIQFFNNIFSDPTGTMNNFVTAPIGETDSFRLVNNLYWNGGASLPDDSGEAVRISDDPSAINGDPMLNAASPSLPVWDAAANVFGGGAADIRAAFVQLARDFATLPTGSAAIDQADASQASAEDILGTPRRGRADLGAYEAGGDESAAAPASTPGPGAGSGNEATQSPRVPSGIVTFTVQTAEIERIYRIAISPGSKPEDLTSKVEAVDRAALTEWVNVSKDSGWYVLSVDGLDAECRGWPCLMVTRDFVTFEVVRSAGAVIHAEYSGIANGGNLIVFKAGEGTHSRDLWAIRREGGAWSAPVELTSPSPFSDHFHPSFSADGSRVIFACGNEPYIGSAICEADTDGSDFSVRYRSEEFGRQGGLLHPDYEADGSILFESNWAGERVWRLAPGSHTPTEVADFLNDNSPCILPDGSIVTLWLEREGNTTGIHEIKWMSADGKQFSMVWFGEDVLDIGIGCAMTR